MLGNRKLESLQTKVDSLEARIDSEHREFVKKEEGLQQLYETLSREVSEIRGGRTYLSYALTALGIVFAALSLIFAVLIWITGSNLIQYQKFEVLRSDAYAILGDMFQNQLADAIDQLTVFTPPTEQERLADDISRTHERLRKLNIETDEFRRRSKLADGLNLVLLNKTEGALEKLDEIIKASVNDTFVNGRALALKAYVIIIKDGRKCKDPDVPDLLNRALDKDSKIAIAYNAMGLCALTNANKMRGSKILSNEEAKSYGENMLSAISYFKTASEIRPTAQSIYRTLNNTVWANCNLFEATLRNGFPMEMFTELTGYKSKEQFFIEARKQLRSAQTLSPKNILAKETRVELLCLDAESEKDKGKASSKRSSVKNDYLQLINDGLFKTVSNCDEAIKTFMDDTLLSCLKDDQNIKKAIRDRYPPGTCHL